MAVKMAASMVLMLVKKQAAEKAVQTVQMLDTLSDYLMVDWTVQHLVHS
jgi:hypothetical protein